MEDEDERHPDWSWVQMLVKGNKGERIRIVISIFWRWSPKTTPYPDLRLERYFIPGYFLTLESAASSFVFFFWLKKKWKRALTNKNAGNYGGFGQRQKGSKQTRTDPKLIIWYLSSIDPCEILIYKDILIYCSDKLKINIILIHNCTIGCLNKLISAQFCPLILCMKWK